MNELVTVMIPVVCAASVITLAEIARNVQSAMAILATLKL